MITKLANKITTYLVHKKIVSWEDVPIYVYGYEAIIASCINFMVVIGLGILFQQVFEALVFFGVFALTRVYSGGYHANSYFRCNIVLA
ncbi:MAG TPA: accessory gene regulator B family protein, partial [Lachnospiraceae bacterium]|nr:accessory gene regulator B family protein [Lachnospiraceae bacterium]